MKQLARRFLPFSAVFSAAATLAQAHPGHTGHEDGGFTWDFSHLTAYPLATLGFVALAGVVAWAGWNHLRSRRSQTAQSLRRSNDNR